MAYDALPAPERVQRTVESVNARGIRAELVETKEAALERVKALIPPGCVVMTGSSVTLQQIGFEEILISGDHPWRNFKADLLAEKDPVKQSALRRQGTLAEFYLGSVNALAETGELVFASGSGSQLPAYSYNSRNVIWVVGAQKSRLRWTKHCCAYGRMFFLWKTSAKEAWGIKPAAASIEF